MFNLHQYGTAQKSALAKTVHPEDLQPNEATNSRRRQSLPPTITSTASRGIRRGRGHVIRGKSGMSAYQRGGGIRAPRPIETSLSHSSSSSNATGFNRKPSAHTSATQSSSYSPPRGPHPLPSKPSFVLPSVPDVQPSPASTSCSEPLYPPKRRKISNSLPESLHPLNLGRPMAKQDHAEKFFPHPPSTGFDAQRPPSPLDKNVSLDRAKSSSASRSRSLLPGLPSGDRDLLQGPAAPDKRAPFVERSSDFDKRIPIQPRAHKLRNTRLIAHSQQIEKGSCDTLPPLDVLFQKPPSAVEQVPLIVKTEATEELSLESKASQTGARHTPVATPIKQELPDPFEVIIPERKLVTESCSFYPIPDNCRKSTPGYKDNRIAFFQKEYRRLQSFGLRKRRVIFRDDGLAIEWTSSIPVWSDTLLPQEETQFAV